MSLLHFAGGKERGRHVHDYHTEVTREAGVIFGGERRGTRIGVAGASCLCVPAQ